MCTIEAANQIGLIYRNLSSMASNCVHQVALSHVLYNRNWLEFQDVYIVSFFEKVCANDKSLILP
jgi:hypothetical protein